MRVRKNGVTLTMTIPKIKSVVKSIDAMMGSRDYSISEQGALFMELDSLIEKLYDDLSSFLKPQGKNEADHAVVKLLEMCCCLQWRARRIGGMGDFCPDCIEHGESAGMATGEIKIIRPPKSIWGSRKKRV